jgi:hypothetical protein
VVHRRVLVCGLLIAASSALSVAIGVGCSSFTEDDSRPDGAISPDGAPLDGPPLDVPDGAADAPLVDARAPIDGAYLDDGFEDGSLCDGWQSTGSATVRPDPPGHTGQRSCVVCTLDGGGGMKKEVIVPSRSTYQGLAWFRTTGGPGDILNFELLGYGAASDSTAYGNKQTPLTSSWQRVEILVGADAGSTLVRVVLATNGAGCMLVDDVSLQGP